MLSFLRNPSLNMLINVILIKNVIVKYLKILKTKCFTNYFENLYRIDLFLGCFRVHWENYELIRKRGMNRDVIS